MDNRISKPANFRDLGGIPVAGGSTVKKFKLLRSGELYGMTEREKHILSVDYHVAEIVDLRSGNEAEERADCVFEFVKNTNIDIMAHAKEIVLSFSSFEAEAGKAEARGLMLGAYDLMTKDDLATKGVARFFRIALEEREGALLFHCFAGKDRTGIIAALLLKLLGAGTEDIYTDYLKTNEQRTEENNRLLEMERSKGKSDGELAALSEFLVVRREYLEYAFENIQKTYGGFGGYIKNALKLTEGDVERLKTLYLE